MNKVVLVGNLGSDPELRYSTGENSTAVCRFDVATNDGYGDKQETNWHRCVTFGKLAENCDRYLAKGRKVAVEGQIKYGKYEKDGRTIYTTDVICGRVEFLSSNSDSEHQQEPQRFAALRDDDIPF